MSIYAKILQIRKELPPFQFDKMEGNVKFVSDEQINTKLVPLLNREGIDTIPHGEIIDNHYKHTIEFVDVDSLERFEASVSWPIDKRNFEFGTTITLADKYVYLKLFKIHTGEEGGKSISDARKDAFQNEKIIQPFSHTGNPNFELPLSTSTTQEEVILPEVTKVDEEVFDGMGKVVTEDPLKDLINQVAKEEDLKPVEKIEKPEKKEEEPSEALMNKINEGEWKIKIPLHKCTNELEAQKALDTMYMNVGTMIYGHSDNDLCPVSPYKVIDQMARRSNLKIRRAIVQYRIYGEEAFWNQLEAETSLKKEEILAKLASPTPEPVKEEIKPIIHELKLDFEIPEHMGVDRDEETCFGLLQNLLRIKLTRFTIIYALGKMKDKPQLDATDDDALILQFLSKGSLLQIEEMIKLAKGAG